MTLAFTGNGDMQVYGLTIKSKTMGKKKITANDLKVTLSEQGITSGLKQEKIIQRLQVNGCLIAMVTDILDQLIKDEQSMFRLLKVQYKQEQKMHYNQMRDAAEKYYFHLKPFNKSFFGDENICANLGITQMTSTTSSSFLRTTQMTTRTWRRSREISERES